MTSSLPAASDHSRDLQIRISAARGRSVIFQSAGLLRRSEAECADIGVLRRHGDRAEDTVPFAPGDDPHIIGLPFFQL